jgi:hypothetical protein
MMLNFASLAVLNTLEGEVGEWELALGMAPQKDTQRSRLTEPGLPLVAGNQGRRIGFRTQREEMRR